MKTLLKKLANASRVGSQGYGIAVVIYLLLRLLVGNNWTTIALLGNCFPWLTLFSLFGLLILLLHRRWKLALLHVPVIAVFCLSYGDLFTAPKVPAIPPGSLPVQVATYNVESLGSEVDQIAAVIRTLDVDVIGLQEVGEDHANALADAAKDEYPYQVFYPTESKFGLGVLSRYPVLDSAIILTKELPSGTRNVLMRAEIEVEDRRLVIYVAHPVVPTLMSTEDRLILYDESIRDAQLAFIREQVKAETMPALLLCDCNMNDQSDGYQILADGLTDAFREAGQGLGFSCAPPLLMMSILPLLWRIDYIWYSDDFVAIESFVGEDDGTSDHRPVVADLRLIP